MKFTDYFLKTKQRQDRSNIKERWIESVIRNPAREIVQSDGRVRLWKRIEEADNKAMRVVLLEDRETVHNAFFDRRYKD